MTDTPKTREMVTLPSTPEKRPSATDFDSIIYVKVGKGGGEQTFDVYKGVLRFYSGYFRTAIENIESGRFAESQNGVIKLPDEEPEIFRLFRGWLYTRVLPTVNNQGPNTEWHRLIKLWCLGDRRDIPLLQNESLNIIAHRSTVLLQTPTTSLKYIWENTAEGAGLRKFMIASICLRFQGPDVVKKSPDNYPSEVLRDLVAYFLEHRPAYQSATTFGKLDKCQWHVHEEGARCKD